MTKQHWNLFLHMTSDLIFNISSSLSLLKLLCMQCHLGLFTSKSQLDIISADQLVFGFLRRCTLDVQDFRQTLKGHNLFTTPKPIIKLLTGILPY